MDDNTLRVSAERKLAVMKRVLLIAQMTEEFCNDKKMLKTLGNALKQEKKKLDASRFPLSSQDKASLSYLLAEITDIVNRFIKAKKAEHFRMASTCLGDFFVRIDKEIAETAVLLEEKSEARQKLETAIGKAKAFSELLGKKLDQGSEYISKKIEEGVDKIKKSIRDRDSE